MEGMSRLSRRAGCPHCKEDSFLEDLHFCTKCDYGIPTTPQPQIHSQSLSPSPQEQRTLGEQTLAPGSRSSQFQQGSDRQLLRQDGGRLEKKSPDRDSRKRNRRYARLYRGINSERTKERTRKGQRGHGESTQRRKDSQRQSQKRIRERNPESFRKAAREYIKQYRREHPEWTKEKARQSRQRARQRNLEHVRELGRQAKRRHRRKLASLAQDRQQRPTGETTAALPATGAQAQSSGKSPSSSGKGGKGSSLKVS